MIDYFFSRQKTRKFENILRQNGFNGGLENFLRQSVLIGVLLFVAGVVFLFFVKAGELVAVGGGLFLFVAGFCSNFLAHYYLFDSRKRFIEKFVPDLLLSAAVFPAGTSISRIIEAFSRTSYPVLSQEFEKCHEEIQRGANAVLALENLKKRNDSPVLCRAVDMIVGAINSGTEVSVVLKDTAEDILETSSILRERSASMTIEKYTLLGAGGLVVPAILGVLIGIMGKLDFAALGEIGIGLSIAERSALLQAVFFASPVYLAEYSFISSFFVAFCEGDLKKGILYSALLVPLSLGVYFFVPGIF